MNSMIRTPIPLAELSADLHRLGHAASVVENALVQLCDTRLVPDNSLPSLHAAKRAALSLRTHLDGARTLVEAE
jgi:hypothetical protein